MRQSPLISCIVPVYNGARYLGEALDSILAQTYSPLEIIVIDDGSTDDSARIAVSYREQVVLLQQTNTGPSSARNRGLAEAKGEFVAFLDADDLWHPEKLVRQMARFEARPELDLCTTHVRNFWIPETTYEQQQLQDQAIPEAQSGASQTLLARRALFERVGPFDPSLMHRDTMEWILTATDQGAVWEVLAEVLVERRIHETNMSRQRSTADREDLLKVVKTTLDRRRENAK